MCKLSLSLNEVSWEGRGKRGREEGGVGVNRYVRAEEV